MQSIGVDFELEGIAYPGEPMVMYYPDGTGYPGSPPEFELVGVHCLSAWGENWEWERKDRPDWFSWLDRVIFDRLYCNQEYEAKCLEGLEYATDQYSAGL
jgi:hypothetical protein